MKISLRWLQEYVDIEMPRSELLNRLTMIGLICEEWTETTDGDTVLDIETYANRPDTLGHLGIAREISTMTGSPLKERLHPVVELPAATSELVEVEVLDEDLCPRYTGFVVKGLSVGPSPDSLRKKIEAMGAKPINNIVDASNIVLFATGHPVHMFDLNKVAGPRVVVRRAKKGETLRTLDGRERAMAPDMLVIADDRRPIAVAGIIGGEESGITSATRDIFIESAVFDPALDPPDPGNALEIVTDASYRSERGADIGFAPRRRRWPPRCLFLRRTPSPRDWSTLSPPAAEAAGSRAPLRPDGRARRRRPRCVHWRKRSPISVFRPPNPRPPDPGPSRSLRFASTSSGRRT